MEIELHVKVLFYTMKSGFIFLYQWFSRQVC